MQKRYSSATKDRTVVGNCFRNLNPFLFQVILSFPSLRLEKNQSSSPIDFFIFLADHISGVVHKLHCDHFAKCNLCGIITKYVNRMLTQVRDGKQRVCKEERRAMRNQQRKYCTSSNLTVCQCSKYSKEIYILNWGWGLWLYLWRELCSEKFW